MEKQFTHVKTMTYNNEKKEHTTYIHRIVVHCIDLVDIHTNQSTEH